MGRLAAYDWRGGLQELSAPPPPPSARDRAGVGYSASILQVPLSPIPPRGLSARRLQTGTMVGFEGFEGGERGARSQTICAEPKCLKCLCRDQLPIHAWPGCTQYDASFSGTCPSHPASNHQALSYMGLGSRRVYPGSLRCALAASAARYCRPIAPNLLESSGQPPAAAPECIPLGACPDYRDGQAKTRLAGRDLALSRPLPVR